MSYFIPTIDIHRGKAVLVLNGKVTEEIGDPIELAEYLSIHSTIQVTDLSRAFGDKEDNREIIKKICQKTPCYVAGGIRTYDDAIEMLNSSAKRVTISTNALPELLSKLHKNRIIAAFDIDENYMMIVKGRQEKIKESLFDRLEKIHQYIELICVTFHVTEGTNLGIPMDQVDYIKNYLNSKYKHIKLTVAGGINSIKQIEALHERQINSQFGYALWKKQFTLGEVFISMLNSDKQKQWITTHTPLNEPLFPTIIIRETGKVLGLVYVTAESLKMSVDTRVATFWSRDKSQKLLSNGSNTSSEVNLPGNNGIWIKGETSGNKFTVKKVIFSCDQTSLLMVVDSSNNVFCHTGKESCFEFRNPVTSDLREFSTYLLNRLDTCNQQNTYTKQLIESPSLIRYKLVEEILELIVANKDNIIHESADVLYFLMMYLMHHKINVGDVLDELTRRRYKVKSDNFITIKRPESIIIGVCFLKEKYQNNRFFELIADIGLDVAIDEQFGKRSMMYKCNKPNIIIQPINPKDVSTLMHNEMIDAVICYDDVIKNNPIDLVRLALKKEYHTTKIVVVAKDDFDFEKKKAEPNYKFKIVAEYKKLAEDWINSMNICAKVIYLSGKTEGFLLSGTADLCVCVYDSGETIKAHNLKIIAELGQHSIGFYSAKNKLNTIMQEVTYIPL
jgi:phosphoribosyl-ATP pyrophosphohydrolase/phosphoribosyl-AMP cyclohydrolase